MQRPSRSADCVAVWTNRRSAPGHHSIRIPTLPMSPTRSSELVLTDRESDRVASEAGRAESAAIACPDEPARATPAHRRSSSRSGDNRPRSCRCGPAANSHRSAPVLSDRRAKRPRGWCPAGPACGEKAGPKMRGRDTWIRHKCRRSLRSTRITFAEPEHQAGGRCSALRRIPQPLVPLPFVRETAV